MSPGHHDQTGWPTMWRPKPMPYGQRLDLQPLPLMAHLQEAVVRTVNDDQPVPCLGRTEWTSDDRRVRARAARLCKGCPVLTKCYVAATEHGERFGVWGGYDLTSGAYYRKFHQPPDPAPRQDGTPTRRASGTN